MAIDAALAQVRHDTTNRPVPLHIRNAPTSLMKELGYGENYRYAHDFEGHFAEQEFMPRLEGRRFYTPDDNFQRAADLRADPHVGKKILITKTVSEPAGRSLRATTGRAAGSQESDFAISARRRQPVRTGHAYSGRENDLAHAAPRASADSFRPSSGDKP